MDAEGANAFQRWAHAVSLSDAERDEIDFHIRLSIKQCLERVQELERGERRTSARGTRTHP